MPSVPEHCQNKNMLTKNCYRNNTNKNGSLRHMCDSLHKTNHHSGAVLWFVILYVVFIVKSYNNNA